MKIRNKKMKIMCWNQNPAFLRINIIQKISKMNELELDKNFDDLIKESEPNHAHDISLYW